MTISTAPVILVGAGMHGRVVRDLCRDAGINVAGYLDDFAAAGTEIEDVSVFGSTGLLDDVEFVASHRFIITIGNNRARKAFAGRVLSAGGALATAIHPSCVISPSATIGAGTVFVGADLMYSRAVVGCSVLVDPDVTIGAECRIDDAAYISPGVHLGSSVHVGALSFVGLGAVVVPDTRIGQGAIVGAGAVVTRDVPDETLVVGNPALPKGKALMDNISPYPSRGRRPIDEH